MPKTAIIRLNWGAAFELAVPAASVLDLMPPGIVPSEPTPGMALLALNILHFVPGGEGIDLPEMYEIDIGVAVPFNNTDFDGLPQAAAAVHVVNIAATSTSYLARCHDSGYRVHPSAALHVEVAQNGLVATVADAAGPITSLAFDCPAATTAPFTRTGQDVVHDHRGLFRLNFVYAGHVLEQSRSCPVALELFPHAFFRGLPVATAEIRGRSLLDPARGGTVTFFIPAQAE